MELRRARQPALDGLRAVAVLLVLACHLEVPHMGHGSRGVDVFFVLSGFLITSIIKQDIEAGVFSRAAFWLRRFRRLMPALAAMVMAYVALAPVLAPDFAADRWKDAAFALTYTMDYGMFWSDQTAPLSHTWSLAIEEQFYLLWPFAVPWLMRRKSPGLILIGLWGGVTVLRLVSYIVIPWVQAPYFMLHTHCTGLLLGAALAFAPPLPRLAWIGWPLLALTVALPSLGWASAYMWSIATAEVASVLLIAHLLQPSRLTTAMGVWPLRQLGLISYGVYLWHVPVIHAIGGTKSAPMKALAFGVTVALAWLSFVTIERWARRLHQGRVVGREEPRAYVG